MVNESNEGHYLKAELDHLLSTDPTIFEFLRKGSLDGVWYWDLENPDHEWMSPEFWKVFGIDPATKQHLASEWQDLIFQDDLALALDNFNAHCADPLHPYDQMVRYRHADGDTVHVRCRGMVIRDESGKPIRMLGAHNDYTELMRLQEDFSSAVLRLKTVLNTATDGIIALDHDKNVLEINPAARHIMGGISDPTPFPWPDNVRFLDREHLRPLDASADPVARAIAGQKLQKETHLMTRNGSDTGIYVAMSGNSLGDDGSPFKTVLVLDDVTELERNLQRTERSNRLDALGQLTGGIAHDFNNLLAIIQYALQLSLDGKLDESKRTYLRSARSAIERGASLTNRLLSFAKQQPARAQSHLVDRLFEEFELLARPSIEETITLHFDNTNTDLLVYCDAPQFENALLNLVLNARDAIIGAGKGDRIRIAARHISGPITDDKVGINGFDDLVLDAEAVPIGFAEAPQDFAAQFVEISISDNGPGMPTEVVRRATDPFFTTKESGSGSGLGLSMVYGFTRQAGGQLRIYSDEGLGTTVRMLLPTGTENGTPEDVLAAIPGTVGDGLSVLVVEDEDALLGMIRDVLKTLGYDVMTARSGPEAMDYLTRGTQFDVLLTDIVMPGGIGGYDLAQRMRMARPKLAVVYMSGYAGVAGGQQSPVTAPFVQKPAQAADLVAAIKRALDEVRRG